MGIPDPRRWPDLFVYAEDLHAVEAGRVGQPRRDPARSEPSVHSAWLGAVERGQLDDERLALAGLDDR